MPSFDKPERTLNRSFKVLLATLKDERGFRRYKSEPIYRTIATHCESTGTYVSALSDRGLTFALSYPVQHHLTRNSPGESPLRRIIAAGADAVLDVARAGGHMRLVYDDAKRDKGLLLLVPPKGVAIPGFS